MVTKRISQVLVHFLRFFIKYCGLGCFIGETRERGNSSIRSDRTNLFKTLECHQILAFLLVFLNLKINSLLSFYYKKCFIREKKKQLN